MRRDYGDKTLKFEVRSIGDLLNQVIPHFRKYPLYSAKQRDFVLFEKICRRIKNKEHLNPTGMKKIVTLAYQMNGSGKRKHLKEYVLAKIISDEDIVYAPRK
jgi:hypothetical protein